MNLKFSVFVTIVTCFAFPINTNQLRQRRSPEPFIAASIQNFLMTSANNFTTQNDTTNPTVIFDSLHHKIKSYRQDKSSLTTEERRLNDTIDEYDLLTEKLMQGKTTKAAKRVRNAAKKLRNVAFQHGEQLIRIAMKAYNRDISLSTEHALSNAMIARENALTDTYVQKINDCLKRLEIQEVVSDVGVENSKKLCHNNFLAATSSVILNSYATMKTANHTILSALDILKNCSEKFKNEPLVECLESEAYQLSQKILRSCADIYIKTLESSNLIQNQGRYYIHCLRNIRINIDNDNNELLSRYDIKPGQNCAELKEDLG